ncbi:PREDICTED: probable peptidyl-tRNA hydrolase 2 [Branchiostoma belcheri]|uniref:peptidyl-tRNA hydrolase n=1 Tax=Branchiostoma belcheri TaxID=7741 RepID=A0A6P4YIF7_BRABE|nr:PREDICTED: probable peptidyl-tRNA hydrolase 2 [Branchiostoma belcheri]XP_019624188.1 PREDICTED: probable peptidyl-tRNA hydrolase 2 [Branchiostoma belcheri]KAI8478708.1 hypothetical protein Bbelb_435570 [Branchiostoma belcheri]
MSSENPNPPPSEASGEQQEWTPNPEVMKQLTAMGIDQKDAENALFYTGNSSAEIALAWLFDPGQSLEGEEPPPYEATGTHTNHYKMVFVVNTDLQMGVGKIAAQVAHACLELYRTVQRSRHTAMLLQYGSTPGEGEMKIVLKGDNVAQLEELASKATALNLPNCIIQDAGRTQIPAGSKTVLGIMGKVETVDQVTGQLELL